MIRSVGLEGMRGYEVLVEADVRNEKEQCSHCWACQYASIKESKERILSTFALCSMVDTFDDRKSPSIYHLQINVKSVVVV
ncbi:hypothetical protein UACE39S_01430 [Ureibacillus acetophenoni]